MPISKIVQPRKSPPVLRKKILLFSDIGDADAPFRSEELFETMSGNSEEKDKW